MSTVLQLIINQRPVSAKSLRIRKLPRGGFRVYSRGKREREFIETIRNLARRAYKGSPLRGAVGLRIFAFFGIKQHKSPCGHWYIKRHCDWDNIGKLVADALKGVVYEDDGQIAYAEVVRMIKAGEGGRVIIIVEKLD